MKLTEQQKQIIRSKLPYVGSNIHACNLCGSTSWSLSETIFELREFHSGPLKTTSLIFPVIPVVCTNCGNTFFLNAVFLGILPIPESAGQKK